MDEADSLSRMLGRLEIVVLTHPCRLALTPEFLSRRGLPHRVFVNDDWELPDDHPELACDRGPRPEIQPYALRQYRAFRGHQEILRSVTKPYALVFEDDAWPTRHSWLRTVLNAVKLLRRFDAVSFHGRNLSPVDCYLWCKEESYCTLEPEPVPENHRDFLKPAMAYHGQLLRWHEGCLAYLIGETGREKWLAAGHGHGLPCDLFLVNGLKTCVLSETCFLHQPVARSLIRGPHAPT